MAEALQTAFKRYVLVLVAAWVAMLAAGILIGRYAGISLPAGAVAILPPMIAALVAGQMVGRATGTVPSGRGAWRFAGFGALVYLGFQILLAAATFASLTRAGGGVQPIGLVFVAGVLALLTAIVVLVNRLFLSIGAKSARAR